MQEVQTLKGFSDVSPEMRRRIFNAKDPACAFYGYVGNEEAVDLAMTLGKPCFDKVIDYGKGAGKWPTPLYAWTRECTKRILLAGPPGCGKTTFARRFLKLIGTNYDKNEVELPYAECDGTAIRKREQVLEAIQNALRERKIPLIPERTTGSIRHCRLPPMVLFIDEVHAKRMADVREGLLKMLESNDGLFEAANYKIDCSRICVIVGTSQPGDLAESFKTRFVRIDLRAHTQEQVARIIKNAHPHWSKANAERLSRLQGNPRRALETANLVDDVANCDNVSIDKAIDKVARQLSLEEGGLCRGVIEALLVLADAQPTGLSRKNLCATLSVSEAEFTNDLMPQMLRNQFHPSLLTVASRHKITEDGLNELRKRGLIDY